MAESGEKSASRSCKIGGGSMQWRLLLSRPAHAARGCCRMCREQREVILLEETSDGGREKVKLCPGRGNEPVVPIGGLGGCGTLPCLGAGGLLEEDIGCDRESALAVGNGRIGGSRNRPGTG